LSRLECKIGGSHGALQNGCEKKVNFLTSNAPARFLCLFFT
jgi:hypothetical protein